MPRTFEKKIQKFYFNTLFNEQKYIKVFMMCIYESLDE